MEDNTETPLTPEQMRVNELTDKINILEGVKRAFTRRKGNAITGISVLYSDGIVTAKTYLEDTSMYTPVSDAMIDALLPLIDKEIEQHTAEIAELNNKINTPS